MVKILRNRFGKLLVTLLLGIIFTGSFYFFNHLSVRAQEQIKIFPTFYYGDWQNPEAAFSQDLGENATSIEFNIANSVYPLEIPEFPVEEAATPPQEGIVFLGERSLELSNFSISDVFKENKINNAHLRLSLAGKGEIGDRLIISYYYQDSWQNLAEFDLENEISNAINGGYFLYALPIFENWQDLENLRIRFVYQGQENAEVYLDSLWLEITTAEQPQSIGKRKDFRGDEEPEFELKESSFAKIKSLFKKEKREIILIGPDGKERLKGWIIQGNKIKIFRPADEKNFRPGLYKLKIKQGGEEIILEFTWGVLAINTNKSIYLPDETAYLQMAALRNDGHTICDANLKLEITTPDGNTLNPVVQKSGECGPNNVTDVPDYFAYYQVGEPGIYEMELTNLDNGYEITDSFRARDSVPFEIERIGPTRIYPPAKYEMRTKIKANQDFAGEVIETVPESFEIVSHETTQIRTRNYTKEIIWQVDWKAGESYELKYQFDAPDISPYLYLLGPLQIGDFKEIRQWQIAADDITIDSPSSTSGGWTNGANAYADGSGYANITSGTPSASQTYGNYGFGLTGDTIDKVEVRYDAWSVGDTTAANQQRVPASDESNTGNFTEAPLWSKVDETTPDDGDFIVAPSTVETRSPTTNTGTAWTNPTRAYDDAGTGAATINSGAPSGNNVWGTYGFNLPGATITQVRARYDAWSTPTIPTFKAAGTFTAGTGSITPPYPAAPNAPVVNDIAILVVESENQPISLTTAQGFVELGAQANKAAGTAATNPASRLAVYWKRCVGGDTAPTVADSGDHTTGQIYLFSGVKTTGNPWNVFAEGNDGGANDTSGVIPGATTTEANCLIFLICTSSRNFTSTAEFSAWTNAGLGSITERGDNTNTAGLGGGHGSATGTKAVAGAYAATTVTLANTSFKGAMSIALEPEEANEQIRVDVSWDGGTSWSGRQTTTTTGSEATYWYDVTGATVWTPAKLADGQLLVRADAQSVGTASTVSLDWLPVEVTYYTAGRATFGSTAFSVPAGSTITNLTIYYRARDATSGANNIRASIKAGGTYYDATDAGNDPGASFTTYSYAFTTNPNTGSAWTVADVNGSGSNPLQAFGVAGTDFFPSINVSMVYAQVNYTTQTNFEQIRVDVSCNGGTSWTSKQTTDLTGTETTYWYDITNVAPCTPWTPDKLNNTNFQVRVDAYTVGAASEVRLDWLPVKVTYTPQALTAYTIKSNALYNSTAYNNARRIVRDRQGGLYTAYFRNDGTTKQIYISYSDDGGETWGEEQITNKTGSNHQNHPTLAIDSQDNLHLAWYGRGWGTYPAKDNIQYMKKTNGEWQAQEAITDADETNFEPSIAIDSEDNVHLTWTVGNALIRYRMRTSEGWQSPEDLTSDFGSFYDSMVAVDLDDNIHLSWWGWNGSYSEIQYKVKTSGGWQETEKVSPEENVNHTYSTIALDLDGNIHIAWYDWGLYNIYYREKTSGGWQDIEQITDFIGGYEQYEPVLAVDATGDVHLLWYGTGWGNNPNKTNIRYRKKTSGVWQSHRTITDQAYNNERVGLLNALWPWVCGGGTNLPDIGYAAIWTSQDESGYNAIYHPSNNLTWRINECKEPTVDSVSINPSPTIALNPGSTETVTINSTITDLNGCEDVFTNGSITARFYRSGVGDSCSENYNNCYVNIILIEVNNTCTGPGDYTADASGTVSIWFYADPTDEGSYAINQGWNTQNWVAKVTATDAANASHSNISTVEMGTLNAFTIEPNSIGYDVVDPDQVSPQRSILITTTGNAPIDVKFSGTQMCTDYPTCEGNIIAVGQQKYSATINFNYNSQGMALTGTAACHELSTGKPTASPSNQYENVYWKLKVPTGKAAGGPYEGTNYFDVVSDTTCP